MSKTTTSESQSTSKESNEVDEEMPTEAKTFLAFLKFREEHQRRWTNHRQKDANYQRKKQVEEKRRKRQWTKLFPIPRVVPVVHADHRCCLAQIDGDQWLRCTRPYASFQSSRDFQNMAVRKKVPLAVDSEATHSNICLYHYNAVNFCTRGQDCSKQEFLFLEYNGASKEKTQFGNNTVHNMRQYEAKWKDVEAKKKGTSYTVNSQGTEKQGGIEEGQTASVQACKTTSSANMASDVHNTQEGGIVECSSVDDEQYEDVYRVIEHVEDGIDMNEEGLSDCSTYDGEIEAEEGEYDEIVIEEIEYQHPPGHYGEYLTYDNELDMDKWNADGMLKYIDDRVRRRLKMTPRTRDEDSDETLSTSSESSCSSQEFPTNFVEEESSDDDHLYQRPHKKGGRVNPNDDEEAESSCRARNYVLEDASFFEGRDLQELTDEIPGGGEADNLGKEYVGPTSPENEDMEFRNIVEYRLRGNATHWMDQLKTPHAAKEEAISESEDEEETTNDVQTGLDTLSAASLRRYRAYFNIPTNSGFTKSRMLQGVEAHLRATPVDTVHSIAAFLNREVREMRPEDYEPLEEEDGDTEYETEVEEHLDEDGPHTNKNGEESQETGKPPENV